MLFPALNAGRNDIKRNSYAILLPSKVLHRSHLPIRLIPRMLLLPVPRLLLARPLMLRLPIQRDLMPKALIMRPLRLKRARHALIIVATQETTIALRVVALMRSMAAAAAAAKQQRGAGTERGGHPRHGEELRPEGRGHILRLQLCVDDALEDDEDGGGGGRRGDGEEAGDVGEDPGEDRGDAREEEGGDAEEQRDDGGDERDHVRGVHPLARLLIRVQRVLPLIRDERLNRAILEVPDLERVEPVRSGGLRAEVRGGRVGGAGAVVGEADGVVRGHEAGLADVGVDVDVVDGDVDAQVVGVDAQEVEGVERGGAVLVEHSDDEEGEGDGGEDEGDEEEDVAGYRAHFCCCCFCRCCDGREVSIVGIEGGWMIGDGSG